MNDIKYAIVTDLDGTFLNSESKPAPANLEAIERFKAAGNYFTIATGRNKIKWVDYANAPVILCNGAYMYDPATDEIINKHSFDGAPAYSILCELHAKFPGPMIRYTDDRDLHYLFKEGEKDDIGDRWYKIVFESASPSPRDTAYKRADLSDICEYLEKNYGDAFRYNFSSPGLFEMLQHGSSKGISIGDLRDYFKGRGENVVICAAGDYENDVEMLDAADIAVCPSNALPSVVEMVRKRAEKGSGIIAADNDSGTIADLADRLLAR